MSSKTMQFLYGDRELIIKVGDLLQEDVDVIVNPATTTLIHEQGLAAKIHMAAGKELQEQSNRLITEYGIIDSGMAVYTDAFDLPFKAVIHAVGPKMGEGEEQQKIEHAVSRSMLLCETNDWNSIAFPAISTGGAKVPVELCAQAFFRSIISFWDARHECALEKIVLCLPEKHFQIFFDAFRNDAVEQHDSKVTENPIDKTENEEVIGYIELSEEELQNLEDDEITDWFK